MPTNYYGGDLDDANITSNFTNYYGGDGNDGLVGDGPDNQFYGGQGNDVIHVNDGASDRVDCGRGRGDVVFVDPGTLDQVANNCEIVIRRAPSPAESNQEGGS